MAQKVLLVDDASFMRMMLKNILVGSGYEVAGEAENGAKAVEQYKALKPDLVMMDIIMPEMGGKECLRELLKIEPELKVVVASGFSSDTSVDESAEWGAKAFVSKPFKIEELLRQVRRILDER